MKKSGGVFITVRDADKAEIGEIAKKFDRLGFVIYATVGTATVLAKVGISVKIVDKIHEGSNNTITLLESGKVNYVISTSAKGRDPARDSVKIRRKASLLGIPCLTAIDTANALADSLMSRYTPENTEIVDINNLKSEKRKLHFTKLQGCGNDYIYINCFKEEVTSPEFLSIYLSDRHKGVGGDGVILICPSDVADAKMRIFNLDGSEGKMCGNGIRCVAKYIYDNKIVTDKLMRIDTLSGIKECRAYTKDGLVNKVCVDMGKAELKPELIPVKLEGESVIDRSIKIDGERYKITCVSMGNPHCVVFVNSVDKLDLEKIGKKFEKDPLFPERVNTEFVELIDENTIKMRVWERGSGETMACGTGACASAVAAVLNGHCKKGEDVRVILRGGDLTINYTEETVYMTGNAEKVFDGVVEV